MCEGSITPEMTEYKGMYLKDRPVEDLTKDELIEALYESAHAHAEAAENYKQIIKELENS